jgi:magnesium-transporting ATPase (P-type)
MFFFFFFFFFSAATKIAVVPFESEHKWQAVLVKDGSVPGGRVLHLKGAPERTFPMCQSSVTGDSVTAPSVPLDAPFWEAKAAEMSSKGLRVLACARWCPPVDWDASQLSVAWLAAGPPRLTLVGLIAILDPPRPECIEAIKAFHKAGIVCKMVTGDHPRTAVAIGTALGLATSDGKVFTGPQIDEMSDAQLKTEVLECNVYARASPDNKIRIVKALQAK